MDKEVSWRHCWSSGRSEDFKLGGRQKYHMGKIVVDTCKMVSESSVLINRLTTSNKMSEVTGEYFEHGHWFHPLDKHRNQTSDNRRLYAKWVLAHYVVDLDTESFSNDFRLTGPFLDYNSLDFDDQKGLAQNFKEVAAAYSGDKFVPRIDQAVSPDILFMQTVTQYFEKERKEGQLPHLERVLSEIDAAISKLNQYDQLLKAAYEAESERLKEA